ncbi:uncharacterized protein LOC122059846 isoform X3 [Macadamia integrifolia]|uniref:uncharacterized protein LOC122059846 isoform X3 n=1 Tax=Macadamia integrifolia TaxID=60698 RepID=UPI001C52AAAE|nr:uncharacterized protein LOC122059846 isoform X3 [Macadamia integrifolia]XP_042478823.1 uncharacterized protein LOC122059846 isoform X3 [Macadamia integrifolia]XP_042478824.1 uncharacterized protein LOC122059846 isoform X3 [Macadamia integrifolia]
MSDDEGEFFECQSDSSFLERVVPLGPFCFPNLLLLKPQVVNEFQNLLNNTKAELAKKNDELNELRSLLDNTKAELVKKNDELNELRNLLDGAKVELEKKDDEMKELKKQKIDQDWNPEQFRLSIVAITNSMKRVFVDFGLEPPESGDPKSVLKFLEMLHDLILNKEFNSTFLVAANGILASIASIFEKRSGLTIGMETTISNPARLIESLFTLRGFIDSHFFIDASVIVEDFHLINKDDLPIIFWDSAADVPELKQKDIGAKSINNIDKNFHFYGYFNIPMVGMFKGVLTRVHVNLPDEVMVKLQVGKHTLNDKRFWFVNANGAGIFQKELLSLEDIKFTPSRVLGDRTDFLEFLPRMNRTFVNEKGAYLKFDFIATKNPRPLGDNVVRYYDKDFVMQNPFKLVQFDKNERVNDIIQHEVSFPASFSGGSQKYASWIVYEALGNDCAFTLRNICLIGKIMKASDTFRKNALVSVFFEQSQHGENCYVDALATTFFVFETEKTYWWDNVEKKPPKFI